MFRWLTRRRSAKDAAVRPTVLICEDDYGVREAYKLILNERYNLKLVNNGREAVKVLKRKAMPVMILDLKMPEMDGIEVLRQVKQAAPATQVIISTGYKSVEVAEEAARLGCDDYLIKPFHPNDVLYAVGIAFRKASGKQLSGLSGKN